MSLLLGISSTTYIVIAGALSELPCKTVVGYNLETSLVSCIIHPTTAEKVISDMI
jgi:hypothetical protein